MSKFQIGDYLTLDESYWAYDSYPESGLLIPIWVVHVTNIDYGSYIYQVIGMEDAPTSLESQELVDMFYRKLNPDETRLMQILYG